MESSIQKRYRDAYLIAKGVITVGNVIMALSILVGGLLIVEGIVGPNFTDRFDVTTIQAVGIGGGFLCLLVGVPFSIVLKAQGQMILAVVDTAVNTSPLIDPADKIDLLGA